VQSMLKDCNLNVRSGHLPIKFLDSIYGDKDAEFILTMLPPSVLM